EVFSQQETQARKMEAIGQLAGGIAHDFNNLLTVITGNASLAAASTEPDAKSQVNLERIQKACLKASEMTGRLLAFSRTGPADHGQCDASLELLSLRDLLLPLVRENIDFSLEVGPNLGTVRLAPSELGQIVLNLMSNALDAMPGGGRLVIRASQTKSTEGGEQAAHVVLEAQDEGTGMEQEVAERMFEPFFTTKPAGKGTGLGLSTTYGIVQSAGGTIEVQSRPGEGTMIKIVLPSSNHNALPLEDQRAHMVTSDRSLRILVAEDEKPVRQVAIAALEKAGHEVVGVEDGLAALDLFEQDRDFDLVFSDMVMPKLGGLSLARRLRTLGFRGSLLLCSGYTTELSLEDLKEVQAEFLAKPYSPGSLASAVSAIAQSTMDEERGR
ncbi:MAG: ATP-binding protein, partial [Planctomycetota bacterium]